MDRSLLRQQAQRAALAKRVEHKPFQRAGLPEAPAPTPQFAPLVKAAPRQNNIGNVVERGPEALRWRNTDSGVVRSTGRNDNTYSDWRWGS